MHSDIFEYWKDIGPNTKIHPADADVFRAIQGKHHLRLECLPTPYYGPLRSAPIVLLYLNPGFSQRDVEYADNEEEQHFYWRQRQGNEPLRSQLGLAKKSWWVSRTKRIEPDPETLRGKLAVLEICPYHSKSFLDKALIPKLHSCQVALNWAKTTLFPQAMAKRRVVICLRAAKLWGLQIGSHDGFLFAPRVNRGGYMFADNNRELIIESARKVLSPNYRFDD